MFNAPRRVTLQDDESSLTNVQVNQRYSSLIIKISLNLVLVRKPWNLQNIKKKSISNRPSAIPEDEFNGDNETCCGRITFFHPSIRNLRIYSPISTCINASGLTWSSFIWCLTFITIVMISYAALFFLFGAVMLPGGKLFGLFWLIIASYTLGWTLAYIPYLNIPPVFGMLVTGMIIKNTGLYDIHEQIGSGTTSKIRIFCLTFIMIRAGLQLTTTALKAHPFFLVELAIVPCTMEFFVVSICSRYILQYPWNWAFLNG